jgi:hypothetical protein
VTVLVVLGGAVDRRVLDRDVDEPRLTAEALAERIGESLSTDDDL